MSYLSLNEAHMGTSPYLRAAELMDEYLRAAKLKNEDDNLSGVDITITSAAHSYLENFTESLTRNEAVRSVTINRTATQLQGSFFSLFKSVATHRTTAHLILSRCSIDEMCIPQLIKHANMAPLKQLVLSNCQLNNFHAKQLAIFLKRCPKLTFLSVHGNRITNAGALVISCALTQNCALRTLDLSNNEITSKGVVEIAKAIGQSSISELLLGGHPINKEAGEALAEAIQSSITLQRVDLSSAPIENEAIEAIVAALPKSRYMEDVILAQNPHLDVQNLKRLATARFRIIQDAHTGGHMAIRADSRAMFLSLPCDQLPLSTLVAKARHLDLTNYPGNGLLDPRLNNQVTHLALHGGSIDAALLNTLKGLQSLTLDGSNINMEKDEQDRQG